MEKVQKQIIFLVAGFLLLVASSANAASLYFSPSSGSYEVGSTLPVSIYVSSADQAMNAASGVISFPQDKLEVTSLSKSGSIFTLWVQESAFSNSAGTINFEGIVLNPGFTGATGKIITANFRVKAAGVSMLNFSSGSVLANDGKGTNILTSLGNAQFSLGGAGPTVPEATTPSVVSGAPSAPQISSPTHPDPNKWYAKKDAKFTWQVPANVTAVRLLVGKIPAAIPTVVYTPAISEKEVTNLTDGIWYFHVQLRNASGWGGITHFRFQIDTEPPAPFEIKFVDGNKTENPKPTVTFDTTDSLSGIDYYKIKIGEGDSFPMAFEVIKSNPYALPPQNPGKRSILVQAYDKAGNYTTAVEEFEILPIKSPIITEYPKTLASGEILIVKGTSYPNAQVVIWLQREKDEPQSQITKSDENGNFTFVAEEKLKDGIYKMWAEAVDERDARSNPTEKMTIVVERPAFLRIGSQIINYLAVIIILIACLLLLAGLLWYGWRKISLLRKRVIKETREAERALHKAFDLLKENMQKQVEMLEKARTQRQLTEEEEKIVKQLKKDLGDIERFVRKEIRDIEREVK